MAEDLTVVTSYPEEVSGLFLKAFETAHPEISVHLLWQQGRDAYKLLSREDHGGVDVYWATSSDNFPRLRREGAFQKLDIDRTGLPGAIGADRLSDPDNYYEAFEVAGYGLAYGPKALWQDKAPPGDWHAAANPALTGKVILPRAEKVGFAPSLYEIILQGEGWENGWALLSEIGGNGVLSAQGHTMEPLVEGSAALALTIDFIPLAAAANGEQVAIAYPEKTAFLPAHVAQLQGSHHPQAAKTFIEFLLSAEGQKLLLQPDVGRHPIRPDVYPKEGAFENPFRLPPSTLIAFDHKLGGARRTLIARLFEIAITERHEALVSLWRGIQQAEAALRNRPDDIKAKQVAEARRLAGFVPVSAAQAQDFDFLARMDRRPSLVPAEVSAQWAQAIDEARTRATALLTNSTKP
ncbi:ABC transporter substrate-binding protein [Beijerinckia indica]|nr:extracellular solute-binding protein [Beijerinckia indica]